MTTNEMILAVIAIIGVIAFAIHILKKRTPEEEAIRFANNLRSTSDKLKFDDKNLYIKQIELYRAYYNHDVYVELMTLVNNIKEK